MDKGEAQLEVSKHSFHPKGARVGDWAHISVGDVYKLIDDIYDNNECCRRKIEEAIEKVGGMENKYHYAQVVGILESLLPTDTPDKPSENKEELPIEKLSAVEYRSLWEHCPTCGGGCTYEQRSYCPYCKETVRASTGTAPFDFEKEESQDKRIANLEASHRETINNEKCALSLRERVTKIEMKTAAPQDHYARGKIDSTLERVGELEKSLAAEKKIIDHIAKQLDKKPVKRRGK